MSKISPGFSNVDGVFALHPSQAELYYDQLIDPLSPHYNLGGYTRLIGALDIEKFVALTSSLSTMFDSLRINIVVDPETNTPFLKSTENFTQLPLTILDLSKHEAPAQEAVEMLQARFNVSFDLSVGQLWEHSLIKISATESWYYFRAHHLLMDAFGAIKLINYIAAEYNAPINLQQLQESSVYPQFLPETINATSFYHTDQYKKAAAFWKQKFTLYRQPLLQYKTHSLKNISKGKRLLYDINAGTSKFIKQLATQYHISHQQVLIAALITYFNKIDNRTDFVFGIPLHNRENLKQANE